MGRNAIAIYQDLVERFSFENKYNSAKRFVRGLRHKAPEQFDRLEFLPGEEAQVVTHIPNKGKQMVRYYGLFK